MNIKNLFLFACLLAATLLGANNAPSSVAPPAPASFDGGICNLPAPFFFQIDETGTTWAKYVWGGSVTTEHRIRTYRASDNALLNTTNVPPGNLTAVINNLPHGTRIYGIINAVCTGGSDSPNEALSAPKFTLIIELIVNGVNPPEGNITCTLTSPASCGFSSNPNVSTTFKIISTQWPYPSRKFGMSYSGSGPLYRAYFKENNDNDTSPFDFRCTSANSGPDCDGPTEGQIWYLGGGSPVRIARFYPSEPTGTTSYLHFTQLNSGYNIVASIAYQLNPSDPSKGQTFTFSPISGIATASPNPFSESLEVFPANPAAEQISLQLFNLSGQKVLDQQFPGGQVQYSLATAGLSTGFYLLRIEADGEVQTLKVIKSE